MLHPKPVNAATRTPKVQWKKCPKCGYECEAKWKVLVVTNHHSGERFEADICPRCFIEWMNQTFPQMTVEGAKDVTENT